MSEGPKDQKSRCPAPKQVISCLMACFSSAAMSIKSEIPAKIEFSQFFKDNTCAQIATVEPRFNEVAGDRPNLFVKSRVRYIENLDVQSSFRA